MGESGTLGTNGAFGGGGWRSEFWKCLGIDTRPKPFRNRVEDAPFLSTFDHMGPRPNPFMQHPYQSSEYALPEAL